MFWGACFCATFLYSMDFFHQAAGLCLKGIPVDMRTKEFGLCPGRFDTKIHGRISKNILAMSMVKW